MMDKAVFVLSAALVVIALVFGILLFKPHPYTPDIPDVFLLKDHVRDRDLLTEQEKEWARESGVASYTVNGVHYTDLTLPSYYFDEEEEDRVIRNAHVEEMIEQTLCDDHSRSEGENNAN